MTAKLQTAEEFDAEREREFIALLAKGTPLAEMNAHSIRRLREFQAKTLAAAIAACRPCEAAVDAAPDIGDLGSNPAGDCIRAIEALMRKELADG